MLFIDVKQSTMKEAWKLLLIHQLYNYVFVENKWNFKTSILGDDLNFVRVDLIFH